MAATGRKTTGQINTEITAYAMFYPAVDRIFLDDRTNTDDLAYYQTQTPSG